MVRVLGAPRRASALVLAWPVARKPEACSLAELAEGIGHFAQADVADLTLAFLHVSCAVFLAVARIFTAGDVQIHVFSKSFLLAEQVLLLLDHQLLYGVYALLLLGCRGVGSRLLDVLLLREGVHVLHAYCILSLLLLSLRFFSSELLLNFEWLVLGSGLGHRHLWINAGVCLGVLFGYLAAHYLRKTNMSP